MKIAQTTLKKSFIIKQKTHTPVTTLLILFISIIATAITIFASGSAVFFSTKQQESFFGTLEVHVEDNFEEPNSEYKYFLDTGKQMFNVLGVQRHEVIPGAKITILGKRQGNSIKTSKMVYQNENLSSQSSNTEEDLGVVVLLVNFADKQETPITIQEAETNIFTGGDSIKNYLVENSYGKVTMHGDVNGWYTIQLNSPKNFIECKQMGSDFDDAIVPHAVAAADKDINFSLYRRIVIVIPLVPCPWAGKATVGRTVELNTQDGTFLYGTIKLNGEVSQQTIAHEFGHSLGIYLHSAAFECGNEVTIGPLPDDNEPSECYSKESQDKYDNMGKGFYVHMNPYHKEYLGFFNKEQIFEVTQSGIYTLSPYAKQDQDIKTLKVVKELERIDTYGHPVYYYYYMEFRQPIGFDANLPRNNPAYNGLLMRQAPFYYNTSITHLLDMTPTSLPSIPKTQQTTYLGIIDFYDAALPIGQTYHDEYSDIKMTPKEITEDGLKVEIILPEGWPPTNPLF